ncbi:MAG: hypothetical protein AAB739_05260 [Patescibacteria group bacterium]
MKNFWVKRQRGIGITLIMLGTVLLVTVTGYLYSKNSGVKGFSQILPENDTILYFEFPASLDENGALTQKINQFLNIDWNKDILPLAGEKGAFALLKNNDSKRIFPVFFLQTKSREQTLQFLNDHKKLPADNEITFLNDGTALLVSSLYKPSSGARLSENKDFIRLRQNLNSPWFAYANTKNFTPEIENFISQFLPKMPITLPAFKSIGITAENNENIWQGRSYAINSREIIVQNEQAYRAILLPFLPADFEIILSGQNLPSQINKMNSLQAQDSNIPSASDFLTTFKQQYLDGTDFENLFSKEFAVAINGEKILAATELTGKNEEKQISLLREAFMKNAGNPTLITRDVELPDGTKAKELMPDFSAANTSNENFYGIKINKISFGRGKIIYDSATQNKLFVSNDLETLKKSLLLTREGGRSIRETPLYRQFLQPIFKNPEFAGIAASESGIFSFSKRLFADHMETGFMFMVK